MKKKLGDLTLRKVIEICDSPCPTLSCKECREKHSVDYAICHIDIVYDIDTLDLDQEIEVGDNGRI